MNHYLENDAVISDCGRYRYLLRRVWDQRKPRALFVMLNPSTADAKVDDPTIRSCVRLVSGLGYGSLEVVNLYGWRATKPVDLAKAADPVGPENGNIAGAAVTRCDVVICAWGADAMAKDDVTKSFRDLALKYRPMVYCFGRTKGGAPKHPLYIKSGTPLESYV